MEKRCSNCKYREEMFCYNRVHQSGTNYKSCINKKSGTYYCTQHEWRIEKLWYLLPLKCVRRCVHGLRALCGKILQSGH
jgi:hypothetical protein